MAVLPPPPSATNPEMNLRQNETPNNQPRGGIFVTSMSPASCTLMGLLSGSVQLAAPFVLGGSCGLSGFAQAAVIASSGSRGSKEPFIGRPPSPPPLAERRALRAL